MAFVTRFDALVPAMPSTVNWASWPASVTATPRSAASDPSEVSDTALAAPVSFEVSRRCPSTTEALTPPPIVLILEAIVAIESPAATATSTLDAPAARCSVSAAVAEASVLDCVRTSARASALTVTENEAFTALAEAVATIRAGSLDVATGRDENTPAPRSACSAPRSAVSRERMSARPASRALARSAERWRRSTGRRSIAISEVTIASVSIPDEIPVKLSPAISVTPAGRCPAPRAN